MLAVLAALVIDSVVQGAVREVVSMQESLTSRCSVAEYRQLVRIQDGRKIWTDAVQTALRDHEVVILPPSADIYYVDRTILFPSNRRLEASGAVVRLVDGMRCVMFRNVHAQDGTLRPISGKDRDRNISIVGGRFEDWCTKRQGYGRSGRFDETERRIGNYYGVSSLFFFNNCDALVVRDVTIAHAGGFAVQTGDGDGHVYERIRFDRCYADGLHLNGNLGRVLARDISGTVGDDLVALNAYDWLKSSVNFGPQHDIVCENLRLTADPEFKTYPAIRIQPAKFRYEDGTIVDCAISNVVFRNVRGITTFKAYLQTPRYEIGQKPEWSAVGSGGNLHFEDIVIDLEHPIDRIGQYVTSDPLRGHFGAFEFGANLGDVFLNNIDIRFHAGRYPLSHLVVVGPKSCVLVEDGRRIEVFDPYVSCSVDRLELRRIRVAGDGVDELVHEVSFDDVNGDGLSSGYGRVVRKEMKWQ